MGSFVTSTRKVERPQLFGRTGAVGSTGTTVSNAIPNTSVDPQQVTYSYRTSGSVSEEASLVSDSKTTRNGFVTFDPAYDKGHEFWTQRQSVELAAPSTYFKWKDRNGNVLFYRGPLVAYADTIYPTVSRWSSSSSDMLDFGSRAIHATQPLRPNASAAQFIGELFEGLPQMAGAAFLKDRAHILRSAGSEYLNVEFGWLPFISDLRKMATALRRSTAILTQLSRDNGRLVRRRFAFPTKIENVAPVNLPINQMYNPKYGIDYSYLRSPKPTQKYTRTETSVWFAGAFTYAIPTDEGLLGRMQALSAKSNVLFGTRLTPDVLWELAPWSWLIDWKLGVGNLLSNASAYSDDGLVIRYGYLMRHIRKEVVYQAQPQETNLGWGLPLSFTTLLMDSKERMRATPYGFGVSPSSFSDTQWTILGALGMTRGPKSLF